MPFHHISIERPSPRVLGKLRKGGRVRVCSGSGMSLIVHADRYNPIVKSFNKGKAYTIDLTPEEIQANMNPPELANGEMSGKGIFDDIKKGFQKVGKVLAPVARTIGKEVLPVAKDLAKKGVSELAKRAPEIGATLGSSALSGLALLAGQPELVPLAMSAGATLGRAGGKALGGLAEKETNKRIDRFDPYGQQSRGNAPPSRQTATNVLSSPVGVANMGSYLSSLSSEDIEMELARRRGGGYSTPYDTSGGKKVLAQYTDAVAGAGLGGGLYLTSGSRGRGIRSRGSATTEKSSVGVHGNLLGHGLPPALMSQPYSSNFQMASRLPPAYANMIKGGSGLYT